MGGHGDYENPYHYGGVSRFFMLPILSMTALAAPEDSPEDVIITEETPIISETPIYEENPSAPVTGGIEPDDPKPTPKPFTPSGAGTVTDYATDEDGKEFYTITTPDEHFFYLVIDRQKSAENVYFLNAVTVADRLSLAEAPAQSETPHGGTTPPSLDKPDKTEPESEQTQSGGNMGTYIFIGILIILGGAAGWYFKIYRPKQQNAGDGGEYEPPVTDDENDLPGDWDDDQAGDDGSPPWDEDDGENEDGE